MSHIRLKAGIWHWRLRIPKDLQAAIGQREFSATTGTGDKRVANRVAMELTAKAKQRFDNLRRGVVATPGEMSSLTQQLLKKHLSKQHDRIATSQDSLEALEVGLDIEADVWRDVLVHDVWSDEAREFVDNLIAEAGAASDAVSLACSLHTPPIRTNTYTDPESESSPGAPTTAVSPDTETDSPNRSIASPSLAISLACWVQVVPFRMNT